MLQISRPLIAAVFAIALSINASAQDSGQVAQERAQAELELPALAEALSLSPGMTVADVGSGGGAMTVVLGKWIDAGHVFATDVTQNALRTTREYAKKEGLTNVTVIEGGAAATNLPSDCCDAAFLRNVYHHITEPAAFNTSLYASLKPGARLAIIDFVPEKGSRLSDGVPANRGGHGIPAAVVVEELKAAGFTHVSTIDVWPPVGSKCSGCFLALFRK